MTGGRHGSNEGLGVRFSFFASGGSDYLLEKETESEGDSDSYPWVEPPSATPAHPAGICRREVSVSLWSAQVRRRPGLDGYFIATVSAAPIAPSIFRSGAAVVMRSRGTAFDFPLATVSTVR